MHRVISNGVKFRVQKKILGLFWWTYRIVTGALLGKHLDFYRLEDAEKFIKDTKREKQNMIGLKKREKILKKWKVIQHQPNSVDFITSKK